MMVPLISYNVGFILLLISICIFKNYIKTYLDKFLFLLLVSYTISFGVWAIYYIYPLIELEIIGSIYDMIPPFLSFIGAILIRRKYNENKK